MPILSGVAVSPSDVAPCSRLWRFVLRRFKGQCVDLLCCSSSRPFFLRSLTTKNPLEGTPRNLRTMPATKAFTIQTVEWEAGLELIRLIFK